MSTAAIQRYAKSATFRNVRRARRTFISATCHVKARRERSDRVIKISSLHGSGFFVDHLLLSSWSCSRASVRHTSSMRFNARLTSPSSARSARKAQLCVPKTLSELMT